MAGSPVNPRFTLLFSSRLRHALALMPFSLSRRPLLIDHQICRNQNCPGSESRVRMPVLVQVGLDSAYFQAQYTKHLSCSLQARVGPTRSSLAATAPHRRELSRNGAPVSNSDYECRHNFAAPVNIRKKIVELALSSTADQAPALRQGNGPYGGTQLDAEVLKH